MLVRTDMPVDVRSHSHYLNLCSETAEAILIRCTCLFSEPNKRLEL